MSNNRYVLAEKTLPNGRVLTRKFTKQTWAAFKPGSVGLDGWKEVVEKPSKPFPEQKMSPDISPTKVDVVKEETKAVTEKVVAKFPEGPYTKEYLEGLKGFELMQLANQITRAKDLAPVKMQKKPILVETIMNMQ